jgi:hypothetical protein
MDFRSHRGQLTVARRSPDAFAVTLRLQRPEDLFVKPDLTPLSPHYQEYSYTSGIEYIAGQLSTGRVRPVHATLELPREFVEPDLQLALADATRRYCASRMVEIEREMHLWRRRSLRALAFALVALVLLIGGSRFVEAWGSAWGSILADGMVIGGWVFCWFPLDTLLFTVRFEELDRRIYEQMASMEIALREIS